MLWSVNLERGGGVSGSWGEGLMGRGEGRRGWRWWGGSERWKMEGGRWMTVGERWEVGRGGKKVC